MPVCTERAMPTIQICATPWWHTKSNYSHWAIIEQRQYRLHLKLADRTLSCSSVGSCLTRFKHPDSLFRHGKPLSLVDTTP